MKTINILKTFYKVTDFVSWSKDRTLDLSPKFQRRSVWKPGTKSYLIDTIIRGLPIPIIFLRDKEVNLKTFKPRREVIDGQQRLRTVLAYIDRSLLKDFDEKRDGFTVKSAHNEELANKRFKDLSSDLQKSILEYQFSVHVLPSHVDDRDVIQIFRRMNSTNFSLNFQELLNAKYFGKFKTSVYRLAEEQLNRWREWKTFTSDTIARMYEVELTGELIILIIKSKIMGRSQSLIDKTYKTNDETYLIQQEVERRFHLVMDAIDDKLIRDMSNLVFKRRSLFYSFFAFFYDVIFGFHSSLDKKTIVKSITPAQIARIKLAGEKIINKSAPEPVLNATTRRTTNLAERRILFNYLHDRPLED